MQASETCPAKVRRVQSWFWRGPCGSCVGPGEVHVCWLLCRPLSRSGLFSSQARALPAGFPPALGPPCPGRESGQAGKSSFSLPGWPGRRQWPAAAAPTRVLSRADPTRASSRSLSRCSPASGECWLCGPWVGTRGHRFRPQNTLSCRAKPPSPARRVGARLQAAGCSRK